jgi:DNA helicase IV
LSNSQAEIQQEQEHVSMLYGRLDELREQARARLAHVWRQAGGTPQARAEREATSSMLTERLSQLAAVENGLCFGRLDFADGAPCYIGRLGIFDRAAGDEPLLIDWRAPAARPFYLATAVAPNGVRRRRRIRTSQRKVIGLADETLDLAAASGQREGLTGEAALLAALNAGRTGRMSDIVETIQAEQDRIIRSPRQGVLVVQGGPGTGKTAVALHRAAYLLYTQREQLAKRVVLIVGPNPTFLRYIGGVLPGLGETSVLLSTIDSLYPGVSADRAEPPATAQIKGRSTMAAVVASAVRDRQRAPAGDVALTHEREVLRVDPQAGQRARDQARSARLPHNQARAIFVARVIDDLAQQYADRIGADLLGGPNLLADAEVEDIRRELSENPAVQAALDRLWPALAPQQLLSDLFSSADRLRSAAPTLTERERDLLLRDAAGGWSAADIPLLDEAAELLGPAEPDWGSERRLRQRDEHVAYAQGVLDISAGSRSTDFDDDEESEILAAHDLLDARELAERHQAADARTPAERAAADRTWAFGHIIVDEAQELSEMAWRMLMRRCPARSMTIVGDLAQSSEPGGASSWERVLAPYVGKRWRLESLTVNYRTPAEIMDLATGVLAELGSPHQPPRSVRTTGIQPWRQQAPPAELAGHLGKVVAEAAAELGERTLAVIVPAARLDELGEAVTAAVPAATLGESPELRSPVAVLAPRQAKGLEFDMVLLVEPAQIVAGSPRGRADLYVALTRATQCLGVVHSSPCRRPFLKPSPDEPERADLPM